MCKEKLEKMADSFPDDKKLVVRIVPPTKPDPQNVIVLVDLLKTTGNICASDGQQIYHIDFKIRQTADDVQPPMLNIMLESDEVVVDQPSKHGIDKDSYTKNRFEVQFRLRKLDDLPMKEKQIFLTIQYGDYLKRSPIYLRWNKAEDNVHSREPRTNRLNFHV